MTLLIKNFIKKILPIDSILEFSKYIYIEKGQTQSREIFCLNVSDFSEKWYNNQLLTLTKQQELAIHSRVVINGKTFHLPLIDFYISDSMNSIKVIESSLNLRNMRGNFLFLYKSGNSYHGYIDRVISKKDWIIYLGELLLCNNSDVFSGELIDSRWVGHCLFNGYASLRLSNNTKKYNIPPLLVKRLSL